MRETKISILLIFYTSRVVCHGRNQWVLTLHFPLSSGQILLNYKNYEDKWNILGLLLKKYKMGIRIKWGILASFHSIKKNVKLSDLKVQSIQLFRTSPVLLKKKKNLVIQRNTSKLLCYYHWNCFLVCLVFFAWCSLPLKNHFQESRMKTPSWRKAVN